MKFAIKFVAKYRILVIVLLIGLSLDLFTKWYVFSDILGITSDDIDTAVAEAEKAQADNQKDEISFEPNRYLEMKRVELVKDHVFFSSVLNPGAFSGILGGNRPVLIGLSIFAVIVLLWIFFHATKITYITQFLGGIILAGALGNFYDRVVFKVVRDFVDCRIPDLPEIRFFNPWNTFNLADAFISVGVLTLTFMLLFTKTEKDKKLTQEDDDSLEKLSGITPTDADYYIVFRDILDINTLKITSELAQITNLPQFDIKRLCRKQKGFIDKTFNRNSAEEISEFLRKTITDVEIVHIDKFPKLSRYKEIFNVEGLTEGLMIDKHKSLGLKPIPWEDVLYLDLAIVAGKKDPVISLINDTIERTQILQLKDLSREEKSKVLINILKDVDKISLWSEFLREQMDIMNAEELKEQKNNLPVVIINIFCKNGIRLRMSSNLLIPSNLKQSRTPNPIVNAQIILDQLMQYFRADKISESTLAFLNKRTNEGGKSVFQTQIIENMVFETEQDYENYLRWLVNTKEKELVNM
ncbi:MAG: signal peptidase II [Planctomycetes bacterium]|nr:signal peptidase II [Planctomycetota bacterium]